MIESLGIVTTACKEVGISRKTYYEYYNTDKDFAKAINDIENIVLDFSESKLHGLIKADNTAAIIFHLKCRGKGRGYFEKQEFKMDKPADQVMIIGGQEIVFH